MNQAFWKHTIISESPLHPWMARVTNGTKKGARWPGRLGAELIMCPLGKRKLQNKTIDAPLPLRSGPDFTSGRACLENMVVARAHAGPVWRPRVPNRERWERWGGICGLVTDLARGISSINGDQPTFVNMKACVLTSCCSHLTNKDSCLSPQGKETDHISCQPWEHSVVISKG